MSKRRGSGEGSILRRADGRWEGRVDLGWRDGRRRRKSVYGRTRTEVASKLQRVQSTVASGLPVPNDRLTVQAWLTLWLGGLPEDLSPNTKANYEWAVRVHLTPAIGKVRLIDLSPSDVNALLRNKATEGLAKSSRMRLRSVLLLAIRQAEVEGLVARNVAALTRAPIAAEREGRSLTECEAKCLLDAAVHEPLEIALKLGLMLGLRPGEVLGLPWENVDLEVGVLHIRQSLKREPEGLRIGAPKTPKSRRSLGVPAPLLVALRTHRARQIARRLELGPAWTETGLVVTTSVGTPVDPKNYRRAFARVTQRAGIGHWSPNELRHSFVSLLHAAGIPLEQIADLVGHDGTRMTSGVYRHLVNPVVSHAVEPVNKMFGAVG